MVDQSTNQIIDMIPARDINDLVEWLKNYNDVEIVTRDGSTTYNSSIEMGLGCTQISDRFHVLKNLTEVSINDIEAIYTPMMVENVTIPYEERMDLKARYDKTVVDINNGISISEACKINQIGYQTYKKIHSMTENELKMYFNDKPSYNDKIKKKNKEKKLEIITKVRNLKNTGVSISQISRDLKINRTTITKYLKDNYVAKLLNSNKEIDSHSMLDRYRQDIIDMVINKATMKNIYLKLVEKGYNGSYSNVKMYISKLKKNGNLTYAIKISKHKLETMLFYKRDEELFHRKYLMKIYEKYPVIKKIIELFREFKAIMFKIKKEKCLTLWIKKAKTLAEEKNLEFLPSFINGLERDLTAVIASLNYSYSNGILESKVNTVKLTKRIMYGRCNFILIKNKALRLERLRHSQ